ncbi:carboxypeptidase-like regulatory domain-containing protein [Parabacteroides gordonii]|uniref:carboxypeptidase-like regulatory domain-containing protein n=1 Tax=Parabacteroides gordonii TaxID=574930 RepID=UPI00216ABF23|nr:carboxypeptidase-like regulatory domain-containing protein [Parabacteroides gordonii]
MADILRDTGFSYHIEGKHIIIVSAKSQQTETPQSSNNPQKIAGVILDATGYPIIGANVVIKGTTTGVISDLDGRFSLEAPQGSKLQISYIGYLSKELTVDGNTTNYNIQLLEDSQALEEVVIVGYGTEKKVNVIGSIAQIGGDKITNRPTSMLSNALAGQMAGVTVIQRSGRPGNNGAEIRIRGVASFGGDDSSKADALVLIDGIPGSLNDINAEDVESISVLKDASTAAIYGARAANGVILVTTKTGKEGKMTVSYNGYVGFNQPTELPEFVDTWRYAELLNEAKGTEFYTQSGEQERW